MNTKGGHFFNTDEEWEALEMSETRAREFNHAPIGGGAIKGTALRGEGAE